MFPDGKDTFFRQDELEKAIRLYQQYLDMGESNVRLSKEIYKSEEDLENDVYEEETTLLHTGEFPL